MISISNLGKSFGDRALFAGVSIQLNRGERYGLVGANGSGKTTLLNVLSGEAAVDPTLGYLLDDGITMINTGSAAMSTAMGESEIDALVSAMERGFARIRETG